MLSMCVAGVIVATSNMYACRPTVRVDDIIKIRNRVGPDYYIDLKHNLCFASYGSLIQLDAAICRKLRAKHTDDGEEKGNAKARFGTAPLHQ